MRIRVLLIKRDGGARSRSKVRVLRDEVVSTTGPEAERILTGITDINRNKLWFIEENDDYERQKKQTTWVQQVEQAFCMAFVLIDDDRLSSCVRSGPGAGISVQ